VPGIACTGREAEAELFTKYSTGLFSCLMCWNLLSSFEKDYLENIKTLQKKIYQIGGKK